MTLPQNGGNTAVEEVAKLTGKAVKTQLSQKSWKNSNLLIMTQDEGQFSIWSLTEGLELKKLLQDGLNDRSFFSFVEVGGQTIDSESQQATQLALLCSSETNGFGSSYRSLNLYQPKAEEGN